MEGKVILDFGFWILALGLMIETLCEESEAVSDASLLPLNSCCV